MGNHVVESFIHQMWHQRWFTPMLGSSLVFVGIAKFGYYNVLKDPT